jgi:CheY-like chemotaxis protein
MGYPTKNCIVLVVEDEALVRGAAVNVLEAHGYGVLQAANSSEALNLIEDRSDLWTLFSDIDMPGGVSGLVLAQEVRRRHPATHIILTSGKIFPVGGAMPAHGLFIGKPYCIDDVSTTIDELYAKDHTPLAA